MIIDTERLHEEMTEIEYLDAKDNIAVFIILSLFCALDVGLSILVTAWLGWRAGIVVAAIYAVVLVLLTYFERGAR